MLKRAINTLQVVLENSDQLWIPVEKTWRLNERHYGDLQVGQTPVSWVLTTVEAGDSICIWGPVGPAIKQQVVPNSLIKQCWVLAELPLHLHACRGRTRLKRPRSMVMSRCTSGAGPMTYLQHVSCCRALLWRLKSEWSATKVSSAAPCAATAGRAHCIA